MVAGAFGCECIRFASAVTGDDGFVDAVIVYR